MEIKKSEESAKESEGMKLHKSAEHQREQGDLNEAVKLHDEAAIMFEREGNILLWAEALAGKVIDYRHLARRDSSFMRRAEETAREAIRVSSKAGVEASTLPIFGLATIQEEMGHFIEASKSYKKACSQPLSIAHNTPAFRANMQVHLAACEYKAGDKDALVRAQEWLTKLRDSEHENQYEYDVWLSGGHMRIADAVRQDNRELALEHMIQAKAIIDKDPQKYHLRQEQWRKLSAKI